MSRLPFVSENVYLYLKMNYTFRGHLRITLTSPGMYDTVLVTVFRTQMPVVVVTILAVFISSVSFRIPEPLLKVIYVAQSPK